MKEHIIYPIRNQSGVETDIKIVPETKPAVNGRRSITGVFHLFSVIPKSSHPQPNELDMDTFMAFAGSLRFLNENFYEWRYEGPGLLEVEILQLVKIIQDHVEEWFDPDHGLPVLKEENLQDPEHALYMSDEQLKEIMDHPLYAIAPYFLYGENDDVIGIVQQGSGFDIHINGDIAACLEVPENAAHRILSGSIVNGELLNEIVRRIRAIREL
jgi:hypothetical protein